MKFLSIVCVITLFGTNLFAQEAVKVCEALARSGLVDTQSVQVRRDQAQIEVDLFCSEVDSFEANYSTKSRGFRASFKRVAQSVGIGANSGTSSGYTKSDFQKLCTDSRLSLRSMYSENIDINIGSALASNVVDCLKVTGKNTAYVYGELNYNFAGTAIIVNVKRIGSLEGGVLKFSGITPVDDFGTCKTGANSSIGQKLFTELAISCPVNQIAGEQPKATTGIMQFCRDDGVCKNLEFVVAVKSYEKTIIENNIAEIERKVDTLLASLEKSVVAFEIRPNEAGLHPTCPNGWSLYQAAQGRFVRGYDRDGEVDPRGDQADILTRRPIGSVWDDTFAEHTHIANMEIGAEPYTGSAKAQEAAGAHGRHGEMYKSTELIQPSGGAETAPKAVVLLYCLRG